jgi:8-oxo-dGTP diphosphatase
MTNATQPLLLVVAGALIDREGRVLLQRRVGGTHAGLWEFPGGKIEPGEIPEAALVREMVEELGVTVDPVDCIPAAFASAALGERHLVLMLFLIRHWQGEPVPQVADALAWVRPSAMAGLAMPPADYPLARQLMRLDVTERPGFDVDPARQGS